jgi:flagellar protein FliJ
MADLNPLIRVRKHAVEQKQKFLAELYRQAEQLADQKSTLEAQLAAERENVRNSDSVDMIKYFSVYADSVKARVKDIDDAVMKLNVRIDIAREDMREAFAEFKKIEITQERREEEEIAVLEKRQADLLDEIAIEGYRRRREEE